MCIIFMCLMHNLVLSIFVFLMSRIFSCLVVQNNFMERINEWCMKEVCGKEQSNIRRTVPSVVVIEPWIVYILHLPPKHVCDALVINRVWIHLKGLLNSSSIFVLFSTKLKVIIIIHLFNKYFWGPPECT